MPTNIPSDTMASGLSPFLRFLDSPLNLQIIFYISLYSELSLDTLVSKLGQSNKKKIIASLDRMKEMGLVEEYKLNNKIHFRTPNLQYIPKDPEYYANFTEDQLHDYLQEEFIYSYRIISLLKSIFGKLVYYVSDFYINRLNSDHLDIEQTKEELQYYTCVPRFGFVNREEFEIYKKRFNKFENELIQELLQRRKETHSEKNPEIEYIITNLFIPIKKVLEKIKN